MTNVQSGYSITQMDEDTRLSVFPYKISTYLPESTPVTGLAYSAGIDTKLSLPVSVSGIPRGFDIFTTLEGSALRFIGSGLGNGDSATFSSDTHASIGSSNVSTVLTLKAKTRHYTETSFANAVDVPGFYIKRNQPNNDIGAVALVAPTFTLNDGDLLEICVNSTNTVSGIAVNAFAFKIKEE